MPEVDPAFSEELARISPDLRCVWGATEQTWEAGGWCLKYPVTSPEILVGFEYAEDGAMRFVEKLGDVPLTVIAAPVYRREEKGEERWIIERWRSPEFLATTGRFQVRYDYTDGEPLIDEETGEAKRDPDTGEVIMAPGSGTELLPPLPPEGHYDFFMRLQNTDGSFHGQDAEALEMVRALWAYEHQYTLGERNQFARDQLADEQKREATIRRETANAAWGFNVDDFTVARGSDGHTKIIRKAREI